MGQGEYATRPLVLAPSQMIEPLRLNCRASQALNDCRPLTEEDVIRFQGVKPNEEVTLTLKKKTKIIVKVIECFHTVPSVGYLIQTEKRKLKSEYRGKLGKEIAALKKSGVDIMQTLLETHFAFLGDTTTEILTNSHTSELLLTAPVIFIECTLIETGDEKKAADRGHVAWGTLKPFVIANPKNKFVLIHFSRKYTDEKLITFFRKEQDNADSESVLDNLVLWLDSGVVELCNKELNKKK
eukprot:TRINITY_DN1595_c0_g1_i1.p1 TRINITY_DN1595_c0_g1~~TRINITY_DN1595_c0_g1_i1.p1  ORF type:complete len:240 (+),score=45.05 TRINITY_DN1595_c0_g1_i1:231-950(+)